MKKTILTVLCAALLLGTTAIPAYAADSETVYVSIADENGDLVLPYQPVTVTDIDGDGALTINDAPVSYTHLEDFRSPVVQVWRGQNVQIARQRDLLR